MQHIAIQLEDERGNLLKRSDINFAKVVDYLWESNQLKSYPWLSGIDPYGNTLINVHQSPLLIKELENLKREPIEKNVNEVITQTIDWLKNIEQHTYLKFIGD